MELQRQKEKRILEEKQTANNLKTEKCELKMRNSIKKSNSLVSIVKPLKPSEEMSENEVRQYMIETKEWKKKNMRDI